MTVEILSSKYDNYLLISIGHSEWAVLHRDVAKELYNRLAEVFEERKEDQWLR